MVFIEVKYRKNHLYGSPGEAVGSVKRKHISRAALNYLIEYFGTEEIPCRFDVVTYTGEQVHIIKNAF